MRRAFILLTVIGGLTGCATATGRYSVMYNSIPQGANLVCGNTLFGVTPYVVHYADDMLKSFAESTTSFNQLIEEARAGGVSELEIQRYIDGINSRGCRAVWNSGATSVYRRVDANTALQHPKGISLTVDHPGDATTRISDANSAKTQQPLPGQQVVPQQPSTPVYQPQPLPPMPSTSFPQAPGRTTTICKTLSNGTIVCN